MTFSNWAKGSVKGLLVVLALAAAFGMWLGVLSLLHHTSCDRLDAARLEHLEPGHDTPGPGSIYVIGVGKGPPPSQIMAYLEAEAAWKRAGC